MRNGWVLLDCRPASEHAKVGITGAVEVPLFLEDTSANISSLVKKATAMGMGGWWLGGTHMVPNDQFLQQVTSYASHVLTDMSILAMSLTSKQPVFMSHMAACRV